MQDPILKRRFQKTDLRGNSNKIWQIELYPNGDATVTWGRVGETPQSKTHHNWSPYRAGLKIDEKLGKGYVEVDLHKPSAVQGAAVSDPGTAQVVNWIFREANEHINSYLAVGVDALSAFQIKRGREMLVAIPKSRNQDEQIDLVQAYYNYIPTQLPRRIDPVELAAKFDLYEQETRLDQLEAALASYTVTQAGGTQQNALGAELRVLDSSSPVYQQVRDYIMSTQKHGYRAKITGIYSVKIEDERRRYENADVIGNCRSLFHGTRNPNIRHILRKGLIVPNNYANGWMMGSGVYTADVSTKSLNYCKSSSGIPRMLLVCDVALGNQYVASDAMQHLKKAPAGYDSVVGKAGHTLSWGGPDKLKFNEYVVYNPSQVTIRALVTLEV